MTLELFACYDAEPYDGPLSPFYIIDGQMDPEALSHFINRLYEYGKDYDYLADNLRGKIDAMLKREFLILGGGMAAKIDSVTMTPGCCIGIEDWREWKNIKPNGFVPWLGHDDNKIVGVTYWIEAKPDYVLFHQQRKGTKDLKIRVSYSGVENAVQKVELGLKEFLKKL